MRSKFLSSAVSIVVTVMAAIPSALWAHDGHGLSGAHWHATDAWGFVVAAAAFSALAVWLGKRGK